METNSMTKNRGGNDGSEKWIDKTLRLIAVFSNGTCMGLNVWIPVGGQVDPSSTVGDNLVWKNAHKNDMNNT